METPVSQLPDWSYNFFLGVGESVRKKTLTRTQVSTDNRSIWFPYGELGFGGHYSPSKLQIELEMMSNTKLVELGKKSVGLKRNVAAVIAGILLAIGGYQSISQNEYSTNPQTHQLKK